MRLLAVLVVLTPLVLGLPNAGGAREQVQLSAPLAKENGVSQAWNAVKGCLHWLEGVTTPTNKAKVHPSKNRTVYETLLADNHFSKFAFLLSQDKDAINYMSDRNESFTLFAPTNWALTKKPHGIPEDLADVTSLATLYRYFVKYPTDESDQAPRRKIVKHILHGVLQYHILPGGAHSSLSLTQNSTVATALTLPNSTLLSTPQRLHLLPALKPLPTLQLNFGTLLLHHDITAVNGIIHGINGPLVLPESIMDGLYYVPWLSDVGGDAPYMFSETASALAKTGLDKALSWKPKHGNHAIDAEDLDWSGEPAVTFFAPTNKAWEALPSELKKFLFGPVGAPVLKKLLQYHVINGSVICADWLKATTVASSLEETSWDAESMAGRSDLWITLPTLLRDHPVTIHIMSNRLLPIVREVTWYKMEVQKKSVEILDWVARNGVVQILGEVLNPLPGRKKSPEEGADEWDGWEDWLVKWGEDA